MQAAPGPADLLQQEGHEPHRAVKSHPGVLQCLLYDAQGLLLLVSHRALLQDTNQRVEKARQEMQELGMNASGV